VHIRRLRFWVPVSVSFETPVAVGVVPPVELVKPVGEIVELADELVAPAAKVA